MTIKCLAFDLDGTLLLDESKRMDPRTVDSIQRAMAQGMHVVIASGRDKNGCKFVYEPLGLENGNHFLALVNGQVVYDFENKEEEKGMYISSDTENGFIEEYIVIDYFESKNINKQNIVSLINLKLIIFFYF